MNDTHKLTLTELMKRIACIVIVALGLALVVNGCWVIPVQYWRSREIDSLEYMSLEHVEPELIPMVKEKFKDGKITRGEFSDIEWRGHEIRSRDIKRYESEAAARVKEKLKTGS